MLILCFRYPLVVQVFRTLFAYVLFISEWYCTYQPIIFQSSSKSFLHYPLNTEYVHHRWCWLWTVISCVSLSLLNYPLQKCEMITIYRSWWKLTNTFSIIYTNMWVHTHISIPPPHAHIFTNILCLQTTHLFLFLSF